MWNEESNNKWSTAPPPPYDEQPPPYEPSPTANNDSELPSYSNPSTNNGIFFGGNNQNIGTNNGICFGNQNPGRNDGIFINMPSTYLENLGNRFYLQPPSAPINNSNGRTRVTVSTDARGRTYTNIHGRSMSPSSGRLNESNNICTVLYCSFITITCIIILFFLLGTYYPVCIDSPGGHAITLNHGAKSFEEATEICQSNNGSVLTIIDENYNYSIQEYLNYDEFAWVDYSNFYSNVTSSEVFNYPEICVQIDSSGSIHMYATPCNDDELATVICQYRDTDCTEI